MTGLSEEKDEVAWYDKDLDDFDITIDRLVAGEEDLEDESGIIFLYCTKIK